MEAGTNGSPTNGLAGRPPVRVAARDVSRRYGEGDSAVHALRGVSLSVIEGELTAVMGPSGSGKSTLMHILAGLDRPTEGDVWIDSAEIGKLGDTELTRLRRRHVGFIFQFFNLLPMLTAEENVVLPLKVGGESRDKAWIDELIDRVGLSERRTHRPAQMSGGQQQRVAIARALVSKPSVVFADEPTGNLDSTTSAEILDLLRHSVNSYGQTTVMVTHDANAATIADRILFLGDGAMIAVALKGLVGRKLRATLTAFAIVLGVAMVSGSFILTDTIGKSFDRISEDSFENADVVISSKEATSSVGAAEAPAFPESVLAEVQRLDSVAAALETVEDRARLVDKQGDLIAVADSSIAYGVDGEDNQPLNPLVRLEGEWPRGGDEVAIDTATAKGEGFRVGDSIGVVANGPVRDYRISGIVQLGSTSSLGGTTIAVFDLETAQTVFDKRNGLDAIQIAAAEGVEPAELAREIGPLLPETAQVRTAEAQAEAESEDTRSGLGFIRYFLLAFGAIALFVGGFVIANTLSITVAQRVRELATLRTIGASRRQVLWSVVLEGAVIGLLASVIGLFLGLAIAVGLDALLATAGIELPSSGLVFSTRTIVVSLLVGTGIAVVASVRPAMRATRVPPIAAVREGAALPASRFARFALPVAVTVVAVATALLAYGVFAGGLSIAVRLL